ncbi:MAG: glycosyltransferase, partial [Alphaproteobacteria bacterium]|nr:glycosyltransferase [Alphaproteobacteria bacterium]
DHYAAADLFAFSSKTETFGNVILEAMASGLPVVALRAGGVADNVQPGVTGSLIEPDAPPARFAEALITLVDDPDLRRRVAASARAFALEQSWGAIMETLRRRYQRAVEETRPDAARALVPRPSGRTEDL